MIQIDFELCAGDQTYLPELPGNHRGMRGAAARAIPSISVVTVCRRTRMAGVPAAASRLTPAESSAIAPQAAHMPATCAAAKFFGSGNAKRRRLTF
jgi:hypothetical protein